MTLLGMRRALAGSRARSPRSFALRTNAFFFVMAALFCVLSTGAAFTQSPLRDSGDGKLLAAGLAVVYVLWSGYWHLGENRRPDGAPARLGAWLGLAVLSVILARLSPSYIALLYMLTGQALGLMRMPLGAPGAASAIFFAAWAATGWQPLHIPTNAAEWYRVGFHILLAVVWIGFGFSMDRLMRSRFRNERLIRELQESQRQLEASAQQGRELAVLRERERLARELHDVLGHALVLAAVKIEAAQRLQPVDSSKATAELDATKQLIRGTMGELRRAVASLRAAPLERQSLATAIADSAKETTARSEIRTTIRCEEVHGLTPIQEEALLRVAQEALTNTLKHASATAVVVRLDQTNGQVRLEVTDDGSGGSSAADWSEAGGYGIRGMQERMELAGGALTVLARPEGGTEVRAEIDQTSCSIPTGQSA
jgi:signal transduction histidine kinase